MKNTNSSKESITQNNNGKLCFKFKDTESLENSYMALEREYTKKCQELSKFKKLEERIVKEKNIPSLNALLGSAVLNYEKQLESGINNSDKVEKSINNSNDVEKSIMKSQGVENGMIESKNGEESINNAEKVESCTDFRVDNCDNFAKNESKDVENVIKGVEMSRNNDDNNAVFIRPDWREKVTAFFVSNPEAKNLSRDIALILDGDKGLAGLDNALDIAYSIARGKTNTKPESLLLSDEDISSLANNPKIYDKVLTSFLAGKLAHKSERPSFSVSSDRGAIISPLRKISSLDEAREILLRELNNK